MKGKEGVLVVLVLVVLVFSITFVSAGMFDWFKDAFGLRDPIFSGDGALGTYSPYGYNDGSGDVREDPDAFCNDSDGSNYLTRGVCEDAQDIYEDSCIRDNVGVQDWHCLNNKCVVSAISHCKYWFDGQYPICELGACVEEPVECTEMCGDESCLGTVNVNLNNGDEVTVQFADKAYTVSALVSAFNQVKVTINGEESSRLGMIDTYQFCNGMVIQVGEIFYQMAAGVAPSVNLTLGEDYDTCAEDCYIIPGCEDSKCGDETCSGSGKVSLNNGEMVRVEHAGASYPISVLVGANDEVTVTVREDYSDKLDIGDTYEFCSGLLIRVDDIIFQEFAGGIAMANITYGESEGTCPQDCKVTPNCKVPKCGDGTCGGSGKISLNNAEMATIEFEGEPYPISALVIDMDEVKITVRDEESSKLAGGDSYQFCNGFLIYIDNIFYQDFAGGAASVNITYGENSDSCLLDCGVGETKCQDFFDGGRNFEKQGEGVLLQGHLDSCGSSSSSNDYLYEHYCSVLINRYDYFYIPVEGKGDLEVRYKGLDYDSNDPHEVTFQVGAESLTEAFEGNDFTIKIAGKMYDFSVPEPFLHHNPAIKPVGFEVLIKEKYKCPVSCEEGACVDIPRSICGNDICEWDENVSTCLQDCALACIPDCSGKICGSDGCGGVCGDCLIGLSCDEGACVDKTPRFLSADWNVPKADEGFPVMLEVDVENCDGEEVLFQIYESDFFADDHVEDMVGMCDGDTARVVWNAQYYDDSWWFFKGNPEYYFRAYLMGNARVNTQSSLLSVSQRDTCNRSIELGNKRCALIDGKEAAQICNISNAWKNDETCSGLCINGNCMPENVCRSNIDCGDAFTFNECEGENSWLMKSVPVCSGTNKCINLVNPISEVYCQRGCDVNTGLCIGSGGSSPVPLSGALINAPFMIDDIFVTSNFKSFTFRLTYAGNDNITLNNISIAGCGFNDFVSELSSQPYLVTVVCEPAVDDPFSGDLTVHYTSPSGISMVAAGNVWGRTPINSTGGSSGGGGGSGPLNESFSCGDGKCKGSLAYTVK
ncbi:hypothetical protein GOV14_04930, partial [Candidatus Pacearchaeota archaeon]|nr:hypothetical protein [Candidatus Pacearchaeota archaeon]